MIGLTILAALTWAILADDREDRRRRGGRV